MPTAIRNNFKEYIDSDLFKSESACFADDVQQSLIERANEVCQDFDFAETDHHIHQQIQDALLMNLVSFATSRNVQPSEVIPSVNFTYENSEQWFNRESPVSESPVVLVYQLESKIARLEAEISQLKAENQVLRGEPVEHLRYKRSKRLKPKFETLEDYFRSIVRAELHDAGVFNND